MEAKRVVVTGLGAVTALGNDVKTTWDNLLQGKSGAGPITHFDASQFKTRFACEVKDLDTSGLMEQKEVRKHDRYSHLAMVAADEAMNDAAVKVENENALRCGVIMGSGMGGVHALDANIGEFASGDGTPRFSPFFIPMAIPNISAGLLAIRYGFRGINFATVSACASSSHAIATAYNYIRFGMADVMLTGGSEAAIEFAGIGGFNAVRALSTRNDAPEHASRPFSASRDGFVLGEGAGCLVLEEYSHAMARGAHIYAEIVGAGMTSDAYHIVASDPEGRGAAEAMALAVQEAGLKPADVEYINTHGTSTPIGDVAEVKAIQQVFGDHAYDMNLTSSKSMTGHLLGGTGAVEAVISILSIVNQVVTPTINHADGDDDPAIDSRLNFTFNEAQPRKIHYALSNNFGFGGHNACLVVREDMTVAIVGASGAVGQELLRILAERHFPVDDLRLFGSKRSAGTRYEFGGKEYMVEELHHGDQFRGVDIAFVSAGGGTSREYAEDITRYGTLMIDNSSAFRMDPQVPLVIPEINASDALQAFDEHGKHIIANPNCTTIVMAMCLKAIEPLSHIRRVHVASYQSASGAGAQAMNELIEQYRQVLDGKEPDVERFAYQLAFNMIPQIDVFGDDDYTKEELKMYNETRKIMHSDIEVSATCVRVPSLRAHSEAVWIETETPVTPRQAKEAFAHTEGVQLVDDLTKVGHAPKTMEEYGRNGGKFPYPMPLFLSGTDDVYVGRIRRDLANPNGLTFWCVGDQIRKGAALNAVQIAEWLLAHEEVAHSRKKA